MLFFLVKVNYNEGCSYMHPRPCPWTQLLVLIYWRCFSCYHIIDISFKRKKAQQLKGKNRIAGFFWRVHELSDLESILRYIRRMVEKGRYVTFLCRSTYTVLLLPLFSLFRLMKKTGWGTGDPGMAFFIKYWMRFESTTFQSWVGFIAEKCW